MSVFVDLSSISDTSSATQDLFSISWNDGAISQGATSTLVTNVGTINVAKVIYPNTTGGSVGVASADRLVTLVNTSAGDNWDFPILITPMDASVNSIEPYTGMGNNVKGNGLTFSDNANKIIHVVYDTSQCLGAGIALRDAANNPIATPNCVVLYHELSHAFHFAINQDPFMPNGICSGNSSDEPGAETDENVLRAELGLCARDVCNHDGGCGSGDSCGGSATPNGPPISGGGSASGTSGGSTGCFIVSASTGSTQSNEVVRLRELRDRISSLSNLSAQLIDGIYLEYFQFSPGIADEIGGSFAAREAVRRMIVRPLFAWYSLAEAVGLNWGDSIAVSHAAQEVLDACPRSLGQFVVLPVLEAIRSGSPLPMMAPRQLDEYLPVIREAVQLPLAHWAIMDPLMRAWSVTSRHLDVLDEVGQWLGNAPIEQFNPPSDPKLCDKELETLGGFLDFHPKARAMLGVRLAKAWPEAADSLKRHNFV